ncbi:MAG TPA: hypothetical protein VGU69_05070 [Rhizomicrobium sp.]|nr:hypothetical protein [Rhizomicrobium sp.]
MLREIVEVRDQERDASAVVIEESDELIAFFQGQPDSGDTEIDQHRMSGVGPHPEIDLQRLTTVILRIHKKRRHDKIIRAMCG